MRRPIALALAFCLAGHGAVANELEAKKAALIAEMNKYDCQMSTPQADISMPQLGMTRPEAIAIAASISEFEARLDASVQPQRSSSAQRPGGMSLSIVAQ